MEVQEVHGWTIGRWGPGVSCCPLAPWRTGRNIWRTPTSGGAVVDLPSLGTRREEPNHGVHGGSCRLVEEAPGVVGRDGPAHGLVPARLGALGLPVSHHSLRSRGVKGSPRHVGLGTSALGAAAWSLIHFIWNLNLMSDLVHCHVCSHYLHFEF